jgi:hypothetical protein
MSQYDTGPLPGTHLSVQRSLLVTLLLACALGWTAVQGASMRCGNRLISDGRVPGTTQAEVLHRCGEPYDRSRQQWLYVKGDAVYRVYFNRNQEVSRITSEIVR